MNNNKHKTQSKTFTKKTNHTHGTLKRDEKENEK